MLLGNIIGNGFVYGWGSETHVKNIVTLIVTLIPMMVGNHINFRNQMLIKIQNINLEEQKDQ
jgi:hypothetical protein